ncbi:restriction endonuclease subunit M [Spirochaetia bacterium]|nr:restriction endonuclease subunit M [Spirochaetia bacterium]
MGNPAPVADTEIREAVCENEEFLTKQLITCIGNKRALLDFIGQGVRIVQNRLHKEKLTMFDVFSGSGIVARYFKKYSGLLIINDLEKYSTVINQCYLSNKDDLNIPELQKQYTEITDRLNNENLIKGIISDLYAPKDEKNISPGDRVFYTTRNAMYIDTARQLIDSIPAPFQKYFIAPLLSEASIHANTPGVFKGFYKNKETGTGQYGGKNRDAVSRITGNITLPFPVFSNFHSDVLICNGDSNEVIKTVPEADIAYLDPPYNQHPYGSNYFMLNVILESAYPKKMSKISGIPENWNRSDYNKGNRALPALTELVTNIKAKYVLISFNSEGFISLDEMKAMLHKIGKVEVLETNYNTFRGSRNLKTRDIHVKEYLYLLEK